LKVLSPQRIADEIGVSRRTATRMLLAADAVIRRRDDVASRRASAGIAAGEIAHEATRI
jgi:ParB-like chromosome segregation protein Spo0J